ncbi:MAG: cobalamin biosynthesis protein [Paracoccaceae bacterium]
MRVAGFGFRAGAELASLIDALAATKAASNVTLIATVTDKAETAVFQALSEATGLAVRAISQEQIEAMPVTTHSAKSQALRGTGSLSEAAALAAAGKDATLITPRAISSDKMATCAIAEGGCP